MKIKHTVFITVIIAFLGIISSCGKISESLERDVIVSPDQIAFDIPLVKSTDSLKQIGTIPVTMNFDSLIRQQTTELGVGNAISFHLNAFQLTLDSIAEDSNFGNFERINVYIVSDSQAEVLIAQIEGNPNSKNGSLNIPLVANRPDLKNFLSSDSFRFSLKGKARNPTTYVMPAKANMRYSLKVGK